jgi:hypothetical protein
LSFLFELPTFGCHLCGLVGPIADVTDLFLNNVGEDSIQRRIAAAHKLFQLISAYPIDEKSENREILRFVFGRMNAIDRANIHTGGIFYIYAWFSNRVGRAVSPSG